MLRHNSTSFIAIHPLVSLHLLAISVFWCYLRRMLPTVAAAAATGCCTTGRRSASTHSRRHFSTARLALLLSATMCFVICLVTLKPWQWIKQEIGWMEIGILCKGMANRSARNNNNTTDNPPKSPWLPILLTESEYLEISFLHLLLCYPALSAEFLSEMLDILFSFL